MSSPAPRFAVSPANFHYFNPICEAPDNDIARQIVDATPPLLSDLKAAQTTLATRMVGAFKEKGQYATSLIESHNITDPAQIAAIKKLSKKDLTALERMLGHPNGRRFLDQLTLQRRVKEGVQQFQLNESRAASCSMRAQNLCYVKMTHAEAEIFINDYVAVFLENMTHDNVESAKAFVSKFDAILDRAEALQRERPRIYSAAEAGLGVMIALATVHMGSDPRPGLSQALNSIDDTTACSNTQILQEAIIACDRSLGGRPDESLYPQRNNTQFCLLREQHPPIRLDGMADATLVQTTGLMVEILVTHPDTLETRTIHLLLPLNGQMSVGQLKQRLRDLNEYLHGRGPFEQAHPGYDLLEAFVQFEETATTELSRAFADFNNIGEWRAGTFARQKTATARFLAERTGANAVDAACEGSIYPLPLRRLSLLPPEALERHEMIAMLSAIEIPNLMISFIRGEAFPINIEMPGGAAQLTFHQNIVNSRLELRTTITRGKVSVTRKTTYPLVEAAEGQSAAETTRQRVVDLSLFERDVLLAKAAFMQEAHGTG
ncbi:MAG: hypothetical protein H7A36_04745 [Chlamydiales bacterium]|nr:hypothetical protein [Chlamydiales bacterium]